MNAQRWVLRKSSRIARIAFPMGRAMAMALPHANATKRSCPSRCAKAQSCRNPNQPVPTKTQRSFLAGFDQSKPIDLDAIKTRNGRYWNRTSDSYRVKVVLYL
jgi:hypothetical protein